MMVSVESSSLPHHGTFLDLLDGQRHVILPPIDANYKYPKQNLFLRFVTLNGTHLL